MLGRYCFSFPAFKRRTVAYTLSAKVNIDYWIEKD